MSKILVCPVAFNEHVKLEKVIQRFIKSRVYCKVDYLVVDDGSDDGTVGMIQRFRSFNVETLRHEKRMGVGSAIRSGVQYAVKNSYDIIVVMAGNNKDDPEEIPLLIDPIINEGYDLVQGSRHIKGGGAGGDMPFYRKIATRIHPIFFSIITKSKITDSTNGFRAIKVDMLKDKEIDLDQSWLDKYELEPYILFKAIRLGYKVKEVPVTKTYPSKKLGYTKMRPITGWWSILRPLIYLGLGIKK